MRDEGIRFLCISVGERTWFHMSGHSMREFFMMCIICVSSYFISISYFLSNGSEICYAPTSFIGCADIYSVIFCRL